MSGKDIISKIYDIFISRELETSLELLKYITKNIEIVDLFNSELGSYYKGEKQFPAQMYQVML